MISSVTSAVSSFNINIENAANASKGDNAYTLMEVFGDIPAELKEKIGSIDGVSRVNIIK